MAKSNVSEWDVVADNNTIINGININENCPPSAVNNAIREMMAQIKMWKDGYTDPISGLPVYQSLVVQNIDVKGIIKLDGSAGTDGQVLVSKGASASPIWGDAFVRGMIMLWTGSVAPSGWALCNGSGGTPDLRDKFVMGAGGSKATTGGYFDTTLPAHSHTGTTNNGGAKTVSSPVTLSGSTSSAGAKTLTATTSITSFTVNTKSQSGYFDTINRGGSSYRNPMVRRGSGTVSVSNKNNSMSFGEGWEGEGGSGGTRTTIDTSHNHTGSAKATTSVTNVPNHTHSISGSGTATVSIPNHTHTFTTASKGDDKANKNLPPYYALAYIMKL